MTETIYIGCDHYVTYKGARDAETGAYLNTTGTHTWTLYAEDRTTQVATGAGAYVAGSNGNYQGTIESTDTAGLAEHAYYWVKQVFAYGGYNDTRWQKCQAKLRGRD